MKKSREISFRSELKIGAEVVSLTFDSLPQKGEEGAWTDPHEAVKYCLEFPTDRQDVGGYFTPTVEINHSGIVTFITPASNRRVTYRPLSLNLGDWHVDFGENGSLEASASIRETLLELDVEFEEFDVE